MRKIKGHHKGAKTQRSLAVATKHNHKDAEDAEKSILDTDLHG
jgi:hypothetical protein